MLYEDNIFQKEMIELISSLKPSEEFLHFLKEVFATFCRKPNQDLLLATFYEKIAKDWRSFFPPCVDQRAINLFLIHVPQKLVVYHKQATHGISESSKVTVKSLIKL